MINHLTTCYFPLNVGNYWVYHSTPFDSNYIVKKSVFSTTTINDTLYYSYGIQKNYSQLIRSDSLGRIYQRINDKDILWFDFTLEDSSTYQYNTFQSDSFIYTVTIKKNLSIKTYAGKFENCVYLFFDIPESIDDEVLYYFAPNIGLVAEYGNVVSHNLYSARIDSQIISKINEVFRQPSFLSLEQNYPNPFNSNTNIEFSIPFESNVNLSVYDLLGVKVKELVNQKLEMGYYNFNLRMADLASGEYICQLKVGDYKLSKKLILIK